VTARRWAAEREEVGFGTGLKGTERCPPGRTP
jgi:hypothetical protein